MGKQKISIGKDILCKLGKYADIPLDELDKGDVIILRDLSLAYVKTVSSHLSCSGKTIDSECVEDAKVAFHTVTRIKLKYTLRQIDTVWGLYRRYDSIIKEYINIGAYSAAHGEAVKVLNDSRSRDKTSKAKHYDEFEVPINNMVALWKEIDKTKLDCRAKINEARGMVTWIKEHFGWLYGAISIFASIFLCTSVETLRSSIGGKFVRLRSRFTKVESCVNVECESDKTINHGADTNIANIINADLDK